MISKPDHIVCLSSLMQRCNKWSEAEKGFSFIVCFYQVSACLSQYHYSCLVIYYWMLLDYCLEFELHTYFQLFPEE